VVVLAGRPNVGKSTLFNRLTRTRDALVADFPGLTRDRQYGIGRTDDNLFVVIDTGGLGAAEVSDDALSRRIEKGSYQALAEADVVVFLVDARSGLTAADEFIATHLRRLARPVLVAVNKAEGVEPHLACAEFQVLGFEHTVAVSAAHGQRVGSLLDQALGLAAARAAEHDESLAPVQLPEEGSIRLAVVGRPNVGKSTLVNRWLGEERTVTGDTPGTTRDSVYIHFERDGLGYTLIDTAGVRRRGRVNEMVEKFSIVKTLQAIAEAHVVVLLVDAREGIVEQDAHLLGLVVQQGRALVIAVNKWDGLDGDRRRHAREALDRRLDFASYADVHYISALHGSQVGAVLVSAARAYEAAHRQLGTPDLTRVLEQAVQAHQPPISGGRRTKLRFAHQGGRNPPLIIVHGNRTQRLPDSYRRYLVNTFRKAFDLSGTPVQVNFRSGENPYAGTPAQRRGGPRRKR
jgi:GTP-binding protein